MSITRLAAYFSPAHTMGSVGLFIDQPLVDRFGKTRPSATRIELIGRYKKRFTRCDIYINPFPVFVPIGILKGRFRGILPGNGILFGG